MNMGPLLHLYCIMNFSGLNLVILLLKVRVESVNGLLFFVFRKVRVNLQRGFNICMAEETLGTLHVHTGIV